MMWLLIEYGLSATAGGDASAVETVRKHGAQFVLFLNPESFYFWLRFHVSQLGFKPILSLSTPLDSCLHPLPGLKQDCGLSNRACTLNYSIRPYSACYTPSLFFILIVFSNLSYNSIYWFYFTWIYFSTYFHFSNTFLFIIFKAF